MLDALKRFFDTRLTGAEPGHDEAEVNAALEIATAALMIEMVRADDHAQGEQDEIQTVEALLALHFQLDEDATANLLALAEDRAQASVSLHEFTRIIHKHFSVSQKTTVVEMLWRVALADGKVDAHEEHLVRKVAELLYLPQAAYIRAKEAAKVPRK